MTWAKKKYEKKNKNCIESCWLLLLCWCCYVGKFALVGNIIYNFQFEAAPDVVGTGSFEKIQSLLRILFLFKWFSLPVRGDSVTKASRCFYFGDPIYAFVVVVVVVGSFRSFTKLSGELWRVLRKCELKCQKYLMKTYMKLRKHFEKKKRYIWLACNIREFATRLVTILILFQYILNRLSGLLLEDSTVLQCWLHVGYVV